MAAPDLSQIDDEEVLTLVLLDSTHPQVLKSADDLKEPLLALAADSRGGSAEAATGEADNKQRAASETTDLQSGEAASSPAKLNRGLVEGLLKRAKAVVDASLKLTLELDSFSFHAMNPVWGTEKSVRQSRKFLVQLLEKVTSRVEALILLLSSILPKLPAPSVPSVATPEEPPSATDPRRLEGGRGRGRGLHPPGVGRGMPLARGSGVGVSPLGSSGYDSDSGTTRVGSAAGETEEDGGLSGSRKHERDNSPEDGPRRWKKKQPSNVDWMLKCRTKLLELKERTAKKAVSDVFMTERTVQETISFIDHNASKLEVVAAKAPSDFAAEDRRIFMQSIESYIAGLERALMLLAKETLNKRQLMGLFDSAVKVERLTTPAELLTEMRSIVSLLNTFAYMPKMEDDD
ncbi:uncharacterized protein LOC34617401 [Cyclospora cayetanensis]|uniref:Uncharacterized protein LOC34617401 n=1 Tax=Cyclospora cayetanensis TaxID=88456 RepID=A0A6P6RUG2_9EIME|nr:uncharacterized protein LOC34617401 [Cyclospora cayetanensis]